MDAASSYSPSMDDLTIEGTIAKVDADQRQIFGWASVTEINGEPVVDLQGDVMETHELEKAAYDYVLNSRVGGEMHERVGKSSPKQVGTLIESMVMTPEKIEKMGLPESTPRGWWIGFQIDKEEAGDAAWDAVKKGKYTGFSIHGLGKRKSMNDVSKSVVNRSPQEIKGWINRVSEQVGVHPKTLAGDLAEFVDGREDELTDDDIHDFIMETYSPDEMTKHLLGSHDQEDHGRKDHAGSMAAAGAGALGVAAAATPFGRRALRHRGAYGPGSPTSFGVGRELPSGPNAGAQNFGNPMDFLRGVESNVYPYNPSRMWSAGETTRRGAQRAAEPVVDAASDVGEFTAGIGRGTRAAGQEIGRQGRARREALWRQDPDLALALETTGVYGALGVGAYGADRAAQKLIPEYGKAAEQQRNERKRRRQQTRENMAENLRRMTGLSEGEPARVRARKRLLKEEIDKHLLGRHEQKDHGRKRSEDELDRAANPEGKGPTNFRGLKHQRGEHKALREAKAMFSDAAIADLNRNAARVNSIIARAKGGERPTQETTNEMASYIKSPVIAADWKESTGETDYGYTDNESWLPEGAEILFRSRNDDAERGVEKHLLGRHDQKDHDPTKGGGHSRSDHTGILRRDGNTLQERRQQRSFDREMDKVAEDAAWQLLSEEVGESEAAHFNVDTRDRYNEIYSQVRSMLDQRLGADDPRPSRSELAQEFVDEPRRSTEQGVGKHLLGRHEQQDHDPTKKGDKRHSRDQHDKTRQKVGGAIGGVAGLAAGGVLGAGALGLLGAEIGSRTGMNQRHKEAERQARLAARDVNVQQEIAAGRLPEGSTGNAMDDAMKFGDMSANEFFEDLGRWAEEKGMGDSGIGTSESAQYMQDRGFWPRTEGYGDNRRLAGRGVAGEQQRSSDVGVGGGVAGIPTPLPNFLDPRGSQTTDPEVLDLLKMQADDLGLSGQNAQRYVQQEGVPSSPEEREDWLQRMHRDRGVEKKRSPMNKQLLAAAVEGSPSREVLTKRVRAIAKTLESRDQDSSYFREVEKHLIGRHEQDDHDPTKKKRSHRRDQHGTADDPGLLSDTQRRGRTSLGAAVLNPLAAASGLSGTTMFWDNNWGRNMPFMDNRQMFQSDAQAQVGRGISTGPIGMVGGLGLGAWSDQRREARGAPGTRTFQNAEQGDGRKKQTQLTKRQKELLSKYLGPDYLGDDQ